jgi:hypothetical protein
VLAATLARLCESRDVSDIFMLTDDADRARALLDAASLPRSIDISAVPPGHPALQRLRHTRALRAFQPASWRGGVSSLTVFDELLPLDLLSNLLESRSIDAALLVGSDWPLLDAALCDDIIRRHRENPARHALTFSQAAPGLAGCVMSRDMARQAAKHAGAPLTVGAMLAYSPARPVHDVIASSACVNVPTRVRDACTRLIADSPAGVERIRLALSCLTSGATLCEQVIDAIDTSSDPRATAPSHLLLECIDPHGKCMPAEQLISIIIAAAACWPEIAITLGLGSAGPRGVGPGGDPLLHPGIIDIARVAAAHALPLHLRTPLTGPASESDLPGYRARLRELLETGALHVCSVDLHAESQAATIDVTGRDTWRLAREHLSMIVDHRAHTSSPLAVVPRLTRRDAVLAEVEAFSTRWMLSLGTAVIDPRVPGPEDRHERAQPLPLPAHAVRARAMSELIILTDATCPIDGLAAGRHWSLPRGAAAAPLTVNAGKLPEIWARLLATRRAALEAPAA